ncbi:MAG: TIGR00266 family protein, partial [Ilumatobacteraceae bacterium]
FSSEGLFMLKVQGTGTVLVSSYGAIQPIDLAPGQTYTVDTGHMVGWSEGVTYEVKKIGGWKSTLLSGEGLVVRLTGPGRIYLQTRSPESFLAWLVPKLPTKSS